MKTHISLLTTIALSAALAFGQQPAKSAMISVTPVVAPGTSVLRHTFNSTSSFFDTAINENSEIAFVSRWIDGGPGGGVFTTHRIVAMEGTTIDGKYVCVIQPESHIGINAAGEVAWTGWYSANKSECPLGVITVNLGLFVDNRFVKDLPFDLLRDTAYPFISLLDDGDVSVSQTPRAICNPPSPPASAVSPAQRGGGIGRALGGAASAVTGGRVVIPPNVIPGGGRPPLQLQPPALCSDPILSMLPFNAKGQFVLSIHTPNAGGLLLLGTKNGR